ncbi:MAG: beta-lactamase family protein [Planctomycetes bacterium]|nr:beta-lactamase family protein [Planctomycetota bacterium]
MNGVPFVRTLVLGLLLWVPTLTNAQTSPPDLTADAFDPAVAAMQRWHDDGVIVGAEFLVIQHGETLRHDVVGWRDREDELPMQADTIFNLRSMTKTLTGAAAQILIDEGKLALDDPVAKYLPGFDTDASRVITIEQLLTHRSGIPLTILKGTTDYPNLIDMANAAGAKGPQFEPGSKFWYSDSGTDVLGAVVSVVTGEPLDAFVKDRLLDPLGMHDCFYVAPKEDDPRKERQASLYVGRPNNWFRFWKPGGDAFHPFAWGSQTLYGTPRDYARFLSMWMHQGKAGEKRILSEDAVRRTTTPVSRMTALGSDTRMPTAFPGFEVFYGQMAVLYAPASDDVPDTAPIWSHSGSDGTIAWAFPERDLIVLYFTQSRGQLTAIRMERDLARILFPADTTPIPASHEPLIGLYHGTIGSLGEQTVEVLSERGTLYADVPAQLVFELQEPDDEGRFHFVISDAIFLTFRRDDSQHVTHLEFHQGPGTFLLERVSERPAKKVVRQITREDVASYLGKYKDEANDEIVTLAFEEGKLVAHAPSVPIPLAFEPPKGDSKRWTLVLDPAVTIDFQEDEQGNVVSYTAYRGDTARVRKRVPEGP